MNIFRDKSPVQRGFFKNSAGDLLSAQRDVKKVKEKKTEFIIVLIQLIFSENPPPFHMYNLGKVDAYSEPVKYTRWTFLL